MQYRGPIMIVFAASLIASPLAIRMMQEAQNEGQATTGIETVGQRQADCAARTLRTVTLTIGCGARVDNIAARHTVAGGALRVRVEH